MKAYRVTVLVVDHDGVGKRVGEILAEQRYPNRCIHPRVLDVEEAEIGEWDDDHPLNFSESRNAAVRRYFDGEET